MFWRKKLPTMFAIAELGKAKLAKAKLAKAKLAKAKPAMAMIAKAKLACKIKACKRQSLQKQSLQNQRFQKQSFPQQPSLQNTVWGSRSGAIFLDTRFERDGITTLHLHFRAATTTSPPNRAEYVFSCSLAFLSVCGYAWLCLAVPACAWCYASLCLAALGSARLCRVAG